MRRAIIHARAHTRAEVLRSVINHTRKSNFWLHAFTIWFPVFYQDIWLFSCYNYTRRPSVIIKLKFCFWKLLSLHRNQKGLLLSPVYKHLKGIFAYRAPEWRKPATCEYFFFKTNLFKEWMKKFVALLPKKKRLKMKW